MGEASNEQNSSMIESNISFGIGSLTSRKSN